MGGNVSNMGMERIYREHSKCGTYPGMHRPGQSIRHTLQQQITNEFLFRLNDVKKPTANEKYHHFNKIERVEESEIYNHQLRRNFDLPLAAKKKKIWL